MPFKPFKKGAKKAAPTRKVAKRGGIAEALDKARSTPMTRIKPKQMPMVDATDRDGDDDMAGC